MKLKNLLVLAVENENTVYVSNLNRLYTYNIETNLLKEIYRFNADISTVLSKFSKIFRRLFRNDIRYAYKIDDENLLAVRSKKIYRINTFSGQIESTIILPRGSRPLNIIKVEELSGFSDGLYFGEYFSNPTKESVKIFQYLNDRLKEVYVFPNGELNHIHNLIVDHYRKCIWILTGDFGEGAAIYQATQNFQKVKCIVSGYQKFRSCVAFPVKEGLVYATDSQFEQNSIRLLFEDNGEWTTKDLFAINGPSIFGTKIGEEFFFSTSVEAINSGNLIKKYFRNSRGPGIIKNQSEIVQGTIRSGFNVIYSGVKDKLPFVLFQFGNIIFPSGNNTLSKLIFTNIALKNDDFTTLIFDI